MTPEGHARIVKAAAVELGFASCGITDLSPPPHGTALKEWLAAGMAGTMGYMPRQAARRLEPARIVEGATRAIVLTRFYDGGESDGAATGRGKVARYARGADYHNALRPPLEALADTVRTLGGSGTVARWFVDAGPVPERELAQRAGLGWIGKNTMLIDPRRGSYAFLASVFTNLDLALDSPFDTDRCGTCRLCLDACPTDAFPSPRVLDARRCISYLTIEYRGSALPSDLTPHLEGWLFGCDVCQEVCPWNVKFAGPVDDPVLAADPNLAALDPVEIVTATDEELNDRLGSTALSRTGAVGLRRNAQALLGDQSD